VHNPLALTALDGDLAGTLGTATYSLLLASMLVAAGSLVVRLGRARGFERQQIKWFAYVGVAFALFFVLRGLVRDVLAIPLPALVLALDVGYYTSGIVLPIVTGLAILRYRLFDIDLIIRLTLIYGTLTALLAGVYIALVVVAQAALRALTGQTGDQPVVVVASTLLVVALFGPLRGGVQTAIDRRFYRRTVDAERTIAAFGQALRGEVDLERLCERLQAVVEQTMQPEHVFIWLRGPERHPAHAPLAKAADLAPPAYPGGEAGNHAKIEARPIGGEPRRARI